MGNLPFKEKKSWVRAAPKSEKWNRNSYPKHITRFYNSSTWRRTSKRHLAKYPTCVHCESKGRISQAHVTDHVIPVMQGGSLLDPRNHQSLCHPCHNSKSATEANGTSEPFVYVGKYKIPRRTKNQKRE